MSQLLKSPLMFSIYIPAALLSIGRGMLIPVLPLYATSFDVSYSLVGFALATQGIGTLIGNIPAGRLLGTFSARWVMMIGTIMVGIPMFIVGFSNSFLVLNLGCLVSGFGLALFNISRHLYIRNETAVENRGRAIAIFGGVNRIGTFLGLGFIGLVGSSITLTTPFLIFAGICGLAALLAWTFAVEQKPEEDARQVLDSEENKPNIFVYLGSLLRAEARLLAPAGLGQLLAQMVRSGRGVVIPLYGAEILDLDLEEIAWIESIARGIDMSLFPVAGMLMDRLGRKFAFVPSFVLQGLGMALVPLCGGYWSLLLVASIIGFGNGLGSGTMMTLGADLAPPKSTSDFLGIWRLIGDSGQTGAPIIVGQVADLLSLPYAAVVIAVTGILAGVTFGVFVPETLKREEQITR